MPWVSPCISPWIYSWISAWIYVMNLSMNLCHEFHHEFAHEFPHEFNNKMLSNNVIIMSWIYVMNISMDFLLKQLHSYFCGFSSPQTNSCKNSCAYARWFNDVFQAPGGGFLSRCFYPVLFGFASSSCSASPLLATSSTWCSSSLRPPQGHRESSGSKFAYS
jgi:hypothetical protein